jgi:hypothetical protein
MNGLDGSKQGKQNEEDQSPWIIIFSVIILRGIHIDVRFYRSLVNHQSFTAEKAIREFSTGVYMFIQDLLLLFCVLLLLA